MRDTECPLYGFVVNELHLFAGSGGGILGGILLGHTCICAVEINSYRRQTILQRQRDEIFPKFPIWDDVKTFDGKPWRGKVDIVCGGFPCQDISPAGTREGIAGKRSGLWGEMARIIRDVRPGFVFVENSAALVVRGLGRILGDLATMGYHARWGVLGASDAIWLDGTPTFDHERLRCFIKASDPDRIRELQSERGVENKWQRPSDDFKETADTHSKRQPGAAAAETFKVYSERNTSAFERSRGRIPVQTATTNNGWWANEPGVGRMVHGLAHRNDRIAAIGDGQVPAVVKLAWETLMSEASDPKGADSVQDGNAVMAHPVSKDS